MLKISSHVNWILHQLDISIVKKSGKKTNKKNRSEFKEKEMLLWLWHIFILTLITVRKEESLMPLAKGATVIVLFGCFYCRQPAWSGTDHHSLTPLLTPPRCLCMTEHRAVTFTAFLLMPCHRLEQCLLLEIFCTYSSHSFSNVAYKELISSGFG